MRTRLVTLILCQAVYYNMLPFLFVTERRIQDGGIFLFKKEKKKRKKKRRSPSVTDVIYHSACVSLFRRHSCQSNTAKQHVLTYTHIQIVWTQTQQSTASFWFNDARIYVPWKRKKTKKKTKQLCCVCEERFVCNIYILGAGAGYMRKYTAPWISCFRGVFFFISLCFREYHVIEKLVSCVFPPSFFFFFFLFLYLKTMSSRKTEWECASYRKRRERKERSPDIRSDVRPK